MFLQLPKRLHPAALLPTRPDYRPLNMRAKVLLDCAPAKDAAGSGRSKQPPVAWDGGADTSNAQRVPHHGAVGGDHRLAEVVFQGLEDVEGWHAGAAQEDSLCFWPICLPANGIGPR